MLIQTSLHRILYLTDPETFASLVLVNHAWHAASQNPQLYAYHLSRCPSFSAKNNVVPGPFTDEYLPSLKRQFIQEVKRNLFEAYLRPRQTTISLISTTTSSSAAFPRGEAFEFSFSPKGRWCLAISSSRIFTIDIALQTVSVKRELKVLRRPLSAAILDDGTRLAVLSTDHKVNIYDLSLERLKFLRSISLDNPPHTITLSPKGEVLAAAYENGVEVHSLAENALPTDQRAVKCDRVDSLVFSSDGTMLLGTTQSSKHPNTMILSAPYFTDTDQDLPHTELISHMWTSQILFPNSSRDCSHATLLPHQPEGDTSWTLTYDRVFESFRAVRTDDLRNGTTYFTGPKPTKTQQRRSKNNRLVPCTLPTINVRGELVAAGFLGSEVWMYGVPEGLDGPGASNTEESSPVVASAGPSTSSGGASTSQGEIATQATIAELDKLPRWQVLMDKYRNVFAKGRRVAKIPGVTGMCWVNYHGEDGGPYTVQERLVIAAPGGVSGSLQLEQEELASVDGGRLIILDFDRTVRPGTCEEMMIEVGNFQPEMLEEENMDMDTEIAIVRRRTVAHRRDVALRASVVDALRPTPATGDIPPVPSMPQNGSVGFGLDSTVATETPIASENPNIESPSEGLSLEEVAEAFDGPYSHTNPRSRNTLYRSATAVEASRRRVSPRVPCSGRIEYRRTDGTELPHESDADNWVPPPPPYTPDPDAPLPIHLQQALLAHPARPPPVPTIPRHRLRSQTARGNSGSDDVDRRRSSAGLESSSPERRRPTWQRQSSYNALSPTRPSPGVINPPSSRAFADGTRPSAMASADAVNLIIPKRRPMSSFEAQRSSALRGSLSTQLEEPVSANPPIGAMGHRRSGSASLPSSPTHVSFPISQNLTLSGANLLQRLDYPLPPPPPPNASNGDVSGRPSPLQLAEIDGEPISITPPLSEPLPEPLLSSNVPSMPSVAQLQNLHNRQSSTLLSELSGNRSSQLYANLGQGSTLLSELSGNRSSQLYTSLAQGYSAPSPPRGALGALGRPLSTVGPRSPSRTSMEAPARTLSRSNSRLSARVQTESTPNLLRPQTYRLDTINSIASRLTHSRNGSQDPEHPMERPVTRMRTMSEGPPVRHAPERGRRRWAGWRRVRANTGMGTDTETEIETGPVRSVGADRLSNGDDQRTRRKGTRCGVM